MDYLIKILVEKKFRNIFFEIYKKLNHLEDYYVPYDVFCGQIFQQPKLLFLRYTYLKIDDALYEAGFDEFVERENRRYIGGDILIRDFIKYKGYLRLEKDKEQIKCPRCGGYGNMGYRTDNGNCWGCNSTGFIPNPNYPGNYNKRLNSFVSSYFSKIENEWFVKGSYTFLPPKECTNMG